MKSYARRIVILSGLFLMLNVGLVQAQSEEAPHWDVGLNIGTAHSLADIGGNRNNARILFYDVQWQASGINLGLFGRYRQNKHFAFVTEMNFAQIAGADSLSPQSSGRYSRQNHFSSNIAELVFKGEAYLPMDNLNIPLEAFAFVGFGLFYHNPDLTVSNFSGYQPASINKIQPVIPMGVGLHYTLANNLRIGYNLTWRMTFTDNVDAYTSSASQGNDGYLFSAFSIGYLFQ